VQVVDPNYLPDHRYAIAYGGAKGIFVGLATALPAAYYAYRRYPYYRSLSPHLKALGVGGVIVQAFIISAETAGRRFEQQQRYILFVPFCGVPFADTRLVRLRKGTMLAKI